MANTKMSALDLAEELDGTEYASWLRPHDLVPNWDETGLVVCFGYSDDLLMFAGAIDDERSCWNGCKAYVDIDGLLPLRADIDDSDDDKLREYFKRVDRAVVLFAVQSHEGVWNIGTNIPHETFMIYDDGDEFSRGIVFALADAHP